MLGQRSIDMKRHSSEKKCSEDIMNCLLSPKYNVSPTVLVLNSHQEKAVQDNNSCGNDIHSFLQYMLNSEVRYLLILLCISSRQHKVPINCMLYPSYIFSVDSRPSYS